MSFLQLGTGTMALLLLGTLAVILFLYWLKPPPQRVVVPSMFIWTRVLRERKRRSDFWRWLVSLLVALAIGLSIATALGRPELGSFTGRSRRVAVIVDNSPTMGAVTASGATRFEVALDRARDLLGERGAGSEYLVADTAGHVPRTEFGSRREALERLEGLTLSFDESRVGGATGVPGSGGDTDTELYFVTDGVLTREFPEGVTVVSVFEPVDNVGITAFDLRSVPAEATRFEAFLEVANTSASEKDVLFQIDGAAGASIQRRVRLQPGEVVGELLDLAEFPPGPVRALIDASDDGYELDDIAYAFLGTLRRVRVLLVTSGNTYLETLLGLDPRVALQVVTPERAEGLETPDLYVLDRYAPSSPPDAPALLFAPPEVAWLPEPTGRVLEGLSLAGAARDHPLTRHVSLADVVVERAAAVQVDDDVDVIIGTELEPVVVAGETPFRWASVGFELGASNLPLQSSFPVFLSNAVDWLTGTDVVASSLGTVAVSVSSGGVTDLEGREVQSRSRGSRTSFAPGEPGLYSVRGRDREVVVSANLLSPTISAVNDSVFNGATAPPDVVSASEVSSGLGELWLVLLGAALALVLLEWWTYHRRMTV